MPFDSLGVRIIQAGRTIIDTEWRAPNVQSTFWRLYLNSSDGAALLLGGEKYALDAGRIYFVPSGVRFSCLNTLPVEHFYIHFDVLGLPKSATAGLFSRPIRLEHADSIEIHALNIRGRMNQSSRRDMSIQCHLKGLIYEALAHHVEHISDSEYNELERQQAAMAPVQAALDAIEHSIADRLTNPVLAALCCMSTDYFARKFHACMDQTPARYVQERRLMRAAQELMHTNRSIDEIASGNGFANRYYFTRVFTRVIGISPAAYRAASSTIALKRGGRYDQ